MATESTLKVDSPAPVVAAVTPVTAAAAGLSAPQDEIEKIMSEIETLQEEMVAVTAGSLDAIATIPAPPAQAAQTASPEPEAVAPAPTPTPAPAAVVAPISEAPVAQAPAAPVEKTEVESMEEFSAKEGDEPWLEETLAQLKAEPASQKGGALSDSPEEVEPAAQGLAALSMEIEGAMVLKLRLKDTPHSIQVRFLEDAVQIHLLDGAEFKMPLPRRS